MDWMVVRWRGESWVRGLGRVQQQRGCAGLRLRVTTISWWQDSRSIQSSPGEPSRRRTMCVHLVIGWIEWWCEPSESGRIMWLLYNKIERHGRQLSPSLCAWQCCADQSNCGGAPWLGFWCGWLWLPGRGWCALLVCTKVMTRPALVASSQTRDQPRSGDLARPTLTSWSHLRGRAHDGTGAGETEAFLLHFKMSSFSFSYVPKVKWWIFN